MRAEAITIVGRVGLALCLVWGASLGALAQFQMPDAREMSGIPRPVSDLPDRSISVRLIRGSLSNNIPNFPVELHVGSKVLAAKTDEAGRAQFDNVEVGATLRAVAVVDGERLESQEFPAPARGGIRLLLVATDKANGTQPPSTKAISGQVAIGGQSRIVMEPVDEFVRLYYLLEIVNNAQAPLNPPTPFVFDLPNDAVSVTLLEGSSPQASVVERQVRVRGSFAQGRTLVQVAYELPTATGSLQLTQRFPASLDQLAVVVKKVGDTRISSSQLTSQQEMAAQGQRYIAAIGTTVPAGQPIVLDLGDLPHHSAAPRWIALSLALMIVMLGVWTASRPGGHADGGRLAAERKRLLARREKLFSDLVRLETERRKDAGDGSRYAARREQLIAALERVYGALDGDDTSPPADRAGLAA